MRGKLKKHMRTVRIKYQIRVLRGLIFPKNYVFCSVWLYFT